MTLRRRNRRGMTIIDVVISVAILLTLTVVCTWSLRNAMQINHMFEKRTNAVRNVAPLLRREIKLAFLTPNIQAVNSYRTVFNGKNEDPDQLIFTSQSHRRLYWDSRESDQTEISIWAEPMPNGEDGYVIYHRESARIDEEPDKDGIIQPLAYNVKSLNFRYLDGIRNEWTEEWDSLSADHLNRLPRAVELSMVYLLPHPTDEGEWVERPQKTTVLLHHAEPIVRSALEASGFGQ